MSNDKPVHEIRLGRIKATLWPNRSENGMRFNVTVCRLYRDGANWKTSESFGRDDILLVCKVLDLAHTWMYAEGAQQSRTEQSTTSDFPIHED